MTEWFTETINTVFGPLLKKVFHPTNVVFTKIPDDVAPMVAKGCAVGLFIATMIWVISLRREYVNLDAPRKTFWCDLRLWTVFSMLPHVIVYLWF